MGAVAKPKRKSKGAYHHGDLRSASIAAARRAIDREGAPAVNLRAIAASLGVSQPAIYRHFADREALLMAVAAEGFRDFSAALRAAGDDIDALGDAYVAFGHEHAGLYRLMFVSRLVPQAAPESELGAAADESHAVLLAAIAGRASGARSRTLATSFWASLHGLVLLAADGFLGPLGVETSLVRAACAVAKGGAK